MIAIIGLGNPGARYEQSRHNIGFLALNYLASAWRADRWKEKNHSLNLTATVSRFQKKVLLAKPQTFMNESGKAVHTLKRYHTLSLRELWVIHDELDIPFLTFKVQAGRGPAGHNGVSSVIQHLGSKNFYRWRLGIAREETRQGTSFVLNKFTKRERMLLPTFFFRVAESLEEAIENSPERVLGTRT